MIRIARIFLVFALILSVGGHWALLQVTAWASMLVSFTQQTSLVDAVSQTFDGEHPCELCKLALRGAAEDRQRGDSAPQQTVKKLELFVVSSPEAGYAAQITETHQSVWDVLVLGSHLDEPVTPPPRALA
jgi:hypothetical protein